MPQRKKAQKQVAMIGYGSQGRALALNLRDSGFDVSVGLRPRSKNRVNARKDGLKTIVTIPDAVRQADVVCFSFPDHLHGRVYRKSIEKHLRSGSTLLFLHGLSVHFGLVVPPAECDVVLLAPHAPGTAVREKYLGDRSVSAFYAIRQNRSRTARATLFALAEACGFEQKRLVKTTFEHEAVGDMFGEQAVLCGGLSALIKNGFEVLTENGLKPEHAYLEVAYQLDLIIALIKQHGIQGMFDRISEAARVGSALTGPRIVDRDTKARMQHAYNLIASGKFARKLAEMDASDRARVGKVLKSLSPQGFERAARKYSK
jgi:ketol-acid reductoisomerase